MRLLLITAFALLSASSTLGFEESGFKMQEIDPSEIKITPIDIKGQGKKSNIDISGIKGVIMKVHFRDKYLKKRGILELSAEIEESFGEEEFDY